MINTIAFIYNAIPEELELAEKWLGLTGQLFKVYSLPTFDPKYLIKPYTYIVTFGPTIAKLINEHIEAKKPQCVKVFNLPSIKKLIKIEENFPNREEALEILKTLKEQIENEKVFALPDLTITEKDLPNLHSNQLILLNKIMEENSQESCICLTKNGKMIEITINPYRDPNPKADISVTIAELYAIKTTMEVLEVNEVILAKNSITSSVSDPPSPNNIPSSSSFEKDKS